MDDFMELGDSGVVRLKDGWFYDRDMGIKFRYDDEGIAVDEQGQPLIPFWEGDDEYDDR